jgi:carbamoyl-phosphate synthase small subunit
VAELVFNTAMTGYQEIMTDPSYAGQVVTFTFPHVGNTGVNIEDDETATPVAAGMVVKWDPTEPSNWRATADLQSWLAQKGRIGVGGIDTRRLTRILREKGSQNGCILVGDDATEEKALELARSFPGLKGMDLAKEVTTTERYEWRSSVWQLKGDFGVKLNILRMLVARGCRVTVVPAKTPASEVLALNPNGVFLSNGPGDPEPCDYAIQAIKEVLETDIPVFGICLGHQLLALASGAKTLKMGHGHHGANHPVQDLDSGVVMITSQNHGFAVDEASLPGNLRATHKSLFDGTLQGIERTDKAAFSFQGHPEASPGPHDVAPLFDRFIEAMAKRR